MTIKLIQTHIAKNMVKIFRKRQQFKSRAYHEDASGSVSVDRYQNKVINDFESIYLDQNIEVWYRKIQSYPHIHFLIYILVNDSGI